MKKHLIAVLILLLTSGLAFSNQSKSEWDIECTSVDYRYPHGVSDSDPQVPHALYYPVFQLKVAQERAQGLLRKVIGYGAEAKIVEVEIDAILKMPSSEYSLSPAFPYSFEIEVDEKETFHYGEGLNGIKVGEFTWNSVRLICTEEARNNIAELNL
jgi:hypothetical protein